MIERPIIEESIIKDAHDEFVRKGDAIIERSKEPITVSLTNYKRAGLTQKEAVESINRVVNVPRLLPVPANERLAHLIQYYAPFMFEIERYRFIEHYGTWKAAFIKAELEEIDKEIEKATETPLAAAVSNKAPQSIGSEFLRLKTGFYEVAVMPDDAVSHTSKTAHAYARYFLFQEYLIELLKQESKPPSLAEQHLAFMQGKNLKNNAEILSNDEYQRMIKALDFYLETGEILEDLKPISCINATKAVYVYALRELHKQKFGSKWEGNFYPLLQALFKQCSAQSNLNTLKRGYTKKPKGYDEFVKYGLQTAAKACQ